jgi:cytochrome o ubiquinol oxidase subunit 1
VGFYVAFMPLYVLGLLGMTRRMQHYTQPEWYPWVLVAGLGALLILTGIALQVAQLTVSIQTRARRREPTGDPWDGRTLEWATSSPPPAYNFAVLPYVENEQPYWSMKLRARESPQLAAEPIYEPIEVPRNSPTGFITAFFAVLTGFSLIWHIWWLVVLGLVGAYATFVVLAWRDVSEETIPAEEVAQADRANRTTRLQLLQRDSAA